MTERQSTTIEQLISTADGIRYVGQFLLTNNCLGEDAEKHARAIKMLDAQFSAIDAEIKAHPDFAAHLAKVQAARAEREQKVADIRRATAASQVQAVEPSRA